MDNNAENNQNCTHCEQDSSTAMPKTSSLDLQTKKRDVMKTVYVPMTIYPAAEHKFQQTDVNTSPFNPMQREKAKIVIQPRIDMKRNVHHKSQTKVINDEASHCNSTSDVVGNQFPPSSIVQNKFAIGDAPHHKNSTAGEWRNTTPTTTTNNLKRHTPKAANIKSKIPKTKHAVNTVEREIANLQKFVDESTARLKEDLESPLAKGIKSVTPRKSSNVNEYNSAHKCHAEKFYDRNEIQKYMEKKKIERREKEKEDKEKKSAEVNSMKRKTPDKVKNVVTEKESVVNDKNKKKYKNDMNTDNVKSKSQACNIAMLNVQSNLAESYVDKACDPVNDKNIKSSTKKIVNIDNRTIIDPATTKPDKKYMEDKNSKYIEEAGINKEKRKNLETKQFEPQRFENDDLPDKLDCLKTEDTLNFFNTVLGKLNLCRNQEVFNLHAPSALQSNTHAHGLSDSINSSPRLKFLEIAEPELTLSDLKRPSYKVVEDLNSPTGPKISLPNPQTTDSKTEDHLSSLSGIRNLNTFSDQKKENSLNDKEYGNSSSELSGIRPLRKSRTCKVMDEVLVVDWKKQENVKHCGRSKSHSSLNVNGVNELYKDVSRPSLSLHSAESHFRGAMNKLNNTELSSSHAENDEKFPSVNDVFLKIYDEMLQNEDDKLSKILQKIHTQKEELRRYLKNEIISLELKKNQCRLNKEEAKMKVLRKRQRAISLKITNNLDELERMKKSVSETVTKRKSEIMKQKDMLNEKTSNTKKKKHCMITASTQGQRIELMNRMASSTSDISVVFNEDFVSNNIESRIQNADKGRIDDNMNLRDTASSPINFDSGVCIQLNLDTSLLHLKNAEIQIRSPLKSIENREVPVSRVDTLHLSNPKTLEESKLNNSPQIVEVPKQEVSKQESSEIDEPSQMSKEKKINIKRPLSPAIVHPIKKLSHFRRLSSGSDVTVASLNETTTDQSDVEVRITALQEQLRQRKSEAERLRREEKQLRKERLKAKEQALIKQLEAYETYIERVSSMLADEQSHSLEHIKPQIKRSKKRLIAPKLNSDDATHKMAQVFHSGHPDNENRLRKADSGILIDSETTELSENTVSFSSSSKLKHDDGNNVDDIPSEIIEHKEKVVSSDSLSKHYDDSNDVDDITSEIVERDELAIFSSSSSKSKVNGSNNSDKIMNEIVEHDEKIVRSSSLSQLKQDDSNNSDDVRSEIVEHEEIESGTSKSEAMLLDGTSFNVSEHLTENQEAVCMVSSEMNGLEQTIVPPNNWKSEEQIITKDENVVLNKSIPEQIIYTDLNDELEQDNSSKSRILSPSEFLQMVEDIRSEVESVSEKISYSSDFIQDISEELLSNRSLSVRSLTSLPEVKSQINEGRSQKISELDLSNNASTPKSFEIGHSHSVDELSNNAQSVVKSKCDDVAVEDSVFNELLNSLHTFVDTKLSPVESVSLIENSNQMTKPNSQTSHLLLSQDDVTNNEGNDKLQLKSLNEILSPIKSQMNQINMNESLKPEDEWNATLSDSERNLSSTFVEHIKSVNSLETSSIQDISWKNAADFLSLDKSMDDTEGKSSSNIKTSSNFLKIRQFYESEGSDAVDVEDRFVKGDEIETVMEHMRSSSEDAVDCIQDEKKSVSTDSSTSHRQSIRKNFTKVLADLKSYFSRKKPSKCDKSEDNTLNTLNSMIVHHIEVEQCRPNLEIVPKLDNSLEEVTDVSESLEFDDIPISTAVPEIRSPSDSTEESFGKLAKSNVNRVTIEEVADEEISKDKVNLHSNSQNSVAVAMSDPWTNNIMDVEQLDTSREKDRSAEEVEEDFSIPNLLLDTFLENNDESMIKKEVSGSSKKAVDMCEDRVIDLDEKISEHQTPFLQALRREVAIRKQESAEKIAGDLFDALMKETILDVSGLVKERRSLSPEMKQEHKEHSEANACHEVEERASVNNSYESPLASSWIKKDLDFDQCRLREAEELRLQQLKIEQEIEELQAQQCIPPYMFVREIPNKPPPPYTPRHALRVPRTEQEARVLVASVARFVCDAVERGERPQDIRLQRVPHADRDATVYRTFIVDLCKEIASREPKRVTVPWQQTADARWTELKNGPLFHSAVSQSLAEIMEDEILALFGFRQRIVREKSIMQWSRKKRTDYVDELLIKELQTEEADWTNYEEDEIAIKNQITDNLMNDLIQETVNLFKISFK